MTTYLESNIGVYLDDHDIEACHTLKGKKDIQAIVVRVCNRKTKTKILKSNGKLRVTGMYINEHLTIEEKCWDSQSGKTTKKKTRRLSISGLESFCKTAY